MSNPRRMALSLSVCVWAGVLAVGSDSGGAVPALRLLEVSGSFVFVDADGRMVGELSQNPGAQAEEAALLAPPQVAGWPLVAGEFGSSSPRVADLDGDGSLEVVVASSDMHLYAIRADGTHVPAFPFFLGNTAGRTPSVADVDADGCMEIFLAASVLHGLRCNATELPGWPFPRFGPDVAVDDLDGDGELEIALMDRDGMAHLLDEMGMHEPGWPFDVGNPVGFSNEGPAVGDTDGDGIKEVVLPISNFPSLHLVDIAGTGRPGFPIDFPFGLGQGLVLADWDGDGAQNIVFQEHSGVWVLDGQGAPLSGFPIEPCPPAQPGACAFRGNAPPAIGDLDGDGRLEIVYATPGGTAAVLAFHDDGRPVSGWPVLVPNFSFNSQVSLGDIDGDGGVDVVVGGFRSDFSTAGRIYAWHADGSPLSGFPFAVPEGKGILASSITITDLDQDGDVDLLVGTITGLGGTNDGRVFAFDLPALYNPTTMEWPTLGHDNQHTARYEPPPRLAAIAGRDEQVECTSGAGALVTLDGSASTDKDSTPVTNDDIVSFEWFRSFGEPGQVLVGNGEMLTIPLAVGTHTFTLLVTDRTGNRDTDDVQITVADTTPPVLSLGLSHELLWPPNHRLVGVSAHLAELADACGPASLALSSIVSSELDDAPGNGDGSTIGDIQGAVFGTDDRDFALRAERDGRGSGRVYTVVYHATDAFENETTVTLEVLVPHDLGGPVEPLLLTAGQSLGGTTLSWNAVPDAAWYDVVRGDLAALREASGAFRLGPLSCIASQILQPTTTGLEDPSLPAPGEGFFYLAAYHDGHFSGYGTESAAKDRVAPPGLGCP